MRRAWGGVVGIVVLAGAWSAHAQLHASARLQLVISRHDRDEIYGYYRTVHAAGHCPAGLIDKSNGCLPPRQELRAWTIGQPLPDEFLYYPLPAVLLGQVSPPPAGYEYARVGNDILVLGIGSRVVIGALAGLYDAD